MGSMLRALVTRKTTSRLVPLRHAVPHVARQFLVDIPLAPRLTRSPRLPRCTLEPCVLGFHELYLWNHHRASFPTPSARATTSASAATSSRFPLAALSSPSSAATFESLSTTSSPTPGRSSPKTITQPPTTLSRKCGTTSVKRTSSSPACSPRAAFAKYSNQTVPLLPPSLGLKWEKRELRVDYESVMQTKLNVADFVLNTKGSIEKKRVALAQFKVQLDSPKLSPKMGSQRIIDFLGRIQEQPNSKKSRPPQFFKSERLPGK